jgi:UDP-N-acetylglucosamine 2-epimerase
MIGNSSAGIIEAPFFRIPTINIGDRQKGRYMHKSIINSNYSVSSISQAIRKARSNSFKIKVKKVNYIFGSGNAAKKIVKKINNLKINQKLLRKK